MKWIFYTYWFWYAIMLFIEVLSIPIPLYGKQFLCLYYLNFSFPAIAAFGLNYTDDLKQSKIYSIGLAFSIFLRTLFWIMETYGFDNKYYLLVLSFFIMAIFFIFEKLIKRKINSIERTLL